MTHSISNSRFYLAGNQVHRDSRSSWLGRKILIWTGLRNYDLAAIFKSCADKKVKNVDKNIQKDVFKALAKKLQLEPIASIFNEGSCQEMKIQSLLSQIWDDQDLYEKITGFQTVLPDTSEQGKILDETMKRYHSLQKWIEVAPYMETEDKQFDLIVHSRQIQLLTKSGLLYQIALFQNSSAQGRNKHKLILKDEKLHFRSEGSWVDVDFLERLEWDSAERRFYSIEDNKKQRWSYLSQPGNEGMIPYDDVYDIIEPLPEKNQDLKPCEQISNNELNILRDHAAKFQYPKPKGEKRDCIFQIVRNPPRPYMSRFMDNFNAQFPNHVYLRIIDNKGQIYSVGSILRSNTLRKLKSLHHFFASSTVHAGAFDPYEAKKHSGRLTTSIPISQANVNELIEYLEDHRKEGRSFNIIRQNCVKLVLFSMKKIGVLDEVDHMSTTVAQKLIRSIPSYDSFGLVGQPVKMVDTTGRVFRKVVKKTSPKCVFFALKCLRKSLMFLPKTALFTLTNLILLVLGGARRIESAPEVGQDEVMQPFERLITSVRDLTKKETQRMYDPTMLTEWMLKQESTVAAHYERPSLNLFPSNNDDELLNVYRERYGETSVQT